MDVREYFVGEGDWQKTVDALDDPISVWSTSALSVLSIPYGFPKFVPRLAEAARKAEQQQ